MPQDAQPSLGRKAVLQDDLRLLPPFCYLSQPINRTLLAVFKLAWRFHWATLALLGFAYLTGIVIINIPMLEISKTTSILVVMSPLMIPLWLLAAYLIPSALLLAFFARHPGVRLGFAMGFCTMVLVPVLSFLLSDTRLLLITGDNGQIVLFLALFLAVPWLYFRYQEALLAHARWSTPALLAVMALFYWEGAIGFSTTRVSPDQFSLSACKSERPVNKHGVKGAPVYSCRLDLSLNGFEYSFPDMRLPDPYFSLEGRQSPQRHLEVRHSLLDHFTLR